MYFLLCSQHKYVGGRITDPTGHCEKLTEYPANQEQEIHQGHGYFEKIHIETIFQAMVHYIFSSVK